MGLLGGKYAVELMDSLDSFDSGDEMGKMDL